MKVDEGAAAQAPAFVQEGFSHVAALSSDARLLVFPLDEIPERPNGGVGVQLLAVPENEQARFGAHAPTANRSWCPG